MNGLNLYRLKRYEEYFFKASRGGPDGRAWYFLILLEVETLAHHKIGVFVAVLTFIGTIIGGGVVGLPGVFYFTGITFGIFLNVMCAFGSIYAVWLLIGAKNITGLTSYSELGYACYGGVSIFVINALIALATAGMPIAYFMIFGHICPQILIACGVAEGSFWSSQPFCVITLALILLGFYIKKEISEIKIASLILFVGVFSFMFILAIKVITGTGGKFEPDYSLWWPQLSQFGLWANLPTLFLAYGFHATYFCVYESLAVKTDANGMRATVISIVICIVIYTSVGIVGLLAYG